MEYVITFANTSCAIKGEKALLRAGLPVAVMPLPPQIRAGCGICLRISESGLEKALNVLAENGIRDAETHLIAPQRDASASASDAGTSRPPFITVEGRCDNGDKREAKPGLPLEHCASGGCGAKIGAGELTRLLVDMPRLRDPRLLVGYDARDDAAVYQLDEQQSIVTTVDFFSPIIEDCETFGRIAAANALSDIYAMGGRPLIALNLVCFPESEDIGLLAAILRGGAEKVAEAGAVLAGGHSIYDKQPKYGLAVTGLVPNDKIMRNNTPALHHKLILTKPLGVGIIMAARSAGLAGAEAVEKAIASMERLNRYAAEKAQGFTVSACTDVTGFGLLGHLIEMAGEQVSFALDAQALPYIEEAYGYGEDFLLTGAGQRNRNFAADKADVEHLPFPLQELLFDPQTSGGLLFCVAAEQAEDLLAAIRADDPQAAIIGTVVERGSAAVWL